MYKFKDLDERVQRNPGSYIECKPLAPEETSNPLEYLYSFSYELDGRLIGSSDMVVDINWGEVMWSSFFPFTHLSGARNKGLGTLTHVVTLETLELATKADLGVCVRNFSVGHLLDIEKPRLTQLEKMGIRWNGMIPYDEYLKKSREYARRIGVL
jgi:hypothetical protein